ncbi:MAG: DUF4215 domain-containing protein [Myxococcota bacterium]
MEPTGSGEASSTGGVSGGGGSEDESGSGASTDDGMSDDGPESTCGDGQVAGDEVCDDGEENGSYGRCALDCGGPASHCGDGVVDPTEACDDGNTLSGDECSPGCFLPGTEIWGQTMVGPWGTASVASVAGEDAGVLVGVNYSNADEEFGYTPILYRLEADGTESWQKELLGLQAEYGWLREVAVNRAATDDNRTFELVDHYHENFADTVHGTWRDANGEQTGVLSAVSPFRLAAVGNDGEQALAFDGSSATPTAILRTADPGGVDQWSAYEPGPYTLKDIAIDVGSGDVIAAFDRQSHDDVVIRRYGASDGAVLEEHEFRVYLSNTTISEIALDSLGNVLVAGTNYSQDIGYIARLSPGVDPVLLGVRQDARWEHIVLDDNDDIIVAGEIDYDDTLHKFRVVDDALELSWEHLEIPGMVRDVTVDGAGDVYIARNGFEQLVKYAG